MASRRIDVTAVTADALADEEIRQVLEPSVVSLWGACVTNGDTLGLRLGKSVIMETDEMNIEASADVIDTDRDQLIFSEIVGVGNLRAPVDAVTTELQFLLAVQPLNRRPIRAA